MCFGYTHLVCTLDVDAVDQVPVRILHVLEAHIAEDTGVVDKDINATKGLDRSVDDAVTVARSVFRSKAWTEFTAVQRAQCLIKLADLMEEHFEELVAIEMIGTQCL